MIHTSPVPQAFATEIKWLLSPFTSAAATWRATSEMEHGVIHTTLIGDGADEHGRPLMIEANVVSTPVSGAVPLSDFHVRGPGWGGNGAFAREVFTQCAALAEKRASARMVSLLNEGALALPGRHSDSWRVSIPQDKAQLNVLYRDGVSVDLHTGDLGKSLLTCHRWKAPDMEIFEVTLSAPPPFHARHTLVGKDAEVFFRELPVYRDLEVRHALLTKLDPSEWTLSTHPTTTACACIKGREVELSLVQDGLRHRYTANLPLLNDIAKDLLTTLLEPRLFQI